MDNAKKHLTDQECCNFCINYQPIKKNGKKTSKGKCRITGATKKRTDKCKKSFSNKYIIKSFFD